MDVSLNTNSNLDSPRTDGGEKSILQVLLFEPKIPLTTAKGHLRTLKLKSASPSVITIKSAKGKPETEAEEPHQRNLAVLTYFVDEVPIPSCRPYQSCLTNLNFHAIPQNAYMISYMLP